MGGINKAYENSKTNGFTGVRWTDRLDAFSQFVIAVVACILGKGL
ncbi:hypothetical protein [Alcaligenes phenolicus]